MQIYLPEELYAEIKQRKLPASELLQQAVRAEIRRQELIDAADEYLQELIEETGEPAPEDLAWAEDVAQRTSRHTGPSRRSVERPQSSLGVEPEGELSGSETRSSTVVRSVIPGRGLVSRQGADRRPHQ